MVTAIRQITVPAHLPGLSSQRFFQKRALPVSFVVLCMIGAPPGTRTLGPLIKSQLLYQLS